MRHTDVQISSPPRQTGPKTLELFADCAPGHVQLVNFS